MNMTRDDFCRELLHDNCPHGMLEPEVLANRFVRCFSLSGRPAMDELRWVLRRTGFGEVFDREMDGLRGAHIGRPGGNYHIYYRSDLWHGAQEYSVLHEVYEIIHETLCDMRFDSPPARNVCRDADRFAAAVLMQPAIFGPSAARSGLDVLALQKEFRCSFAAVTLRLAEVVSHPPLMAVLYEREDKGNPDRRVGPSWFRATVVRRTRGFGAPESFPYWVGEGLFPRRGMVPQPRSLAGRAIRYDRSQFASSHGLTIMARPHFWNGRVAKVSIVTVPERYSSTLSPQLHASDAACRRRGLAGVTW